MKSRTVLLALTLALASCAGVLAAEMGMPPAKSSPAFDQLKMLVGNWEAPMPDGKTAKASYELVSAGSCLMERLDAPDGASMVTMYHLEGSRLVMDHYCAMNNVPHMRATSSPDGKRISFTFASGTNMAVASDPHMHALKVDLQDADHFTQEWSMRSKGKDQPAVFRFQRLK